MDFLAQLGLDLGSDAAALAHRAHLLIEGFLVVLVVYVLLQRRRPVSGPVVPDTVLSEKELASKIKHFVRNRKPLVPVYRVQQYRVPVVLSPPAAELSFRFDDEPTTAAPRTAINLATTNFLGLSCDKTVMKRAETCIRTYGVGACGPRGFYGTIEPHRLAERRIAEFLHAAQALMISSAYASVTTIMPTFAAVGDIVFADAAICHGTRMGLYLSKATIVWFAHNDMADLEAKMREVKAKHERSKQPLTRRWLVTEGVNHHTGQVAPLRKLVELKKAYCTRLLLDDSLAVGVLGATGRGSCEHHGVSIRDIELYVVDVAPALAGNGAFCCAEPDLIAHQRLNTSGYMYSAASPPHIVAAVHAALDQLDSADGLARLARLRANIVSLRQRIAISGLEMLGSNDVAFVPLRLSTSRGSLPADEAVLDAVATASLERGVALLRPKRADSLLVADPDGQFVSRSVLVGMPADAVLIASVSSEHTTAQLDRAASALCEAAAAVLR